jgi:hypothetical protein
VCIRIWVRAFRKAYDPTRAPLFIGTRVLSRNIRVHLIELVEERVFVMFVCWVEQVCHRFGPFKHDAPKEGDGGKGPWPQPLESALQEKKSCLLRARRKKFEEEKKKQAASRAESSSPPSLLHLHSIESRGWISFSSLHTNIILGCARSCSFHGDSMTREHTQESRTRQAYSHPEGTFFIHMTFPVTHEQYQHQQVAASQRYG